MDRPAEHTSSTMERLNRIAMSPYEREKARDALLTAQIFVDLLFAALSRLSTVAAKARRSKVAPGQGRVLRV